MLQRQRLRHGRRTLIGVSICGFFGRLSSAIGILSLSGIEGIWFGCALTLLQDCSEPKREFVGIYCGTF